LRLFVAKGLIPRPFQEEIENIIGNTSVGNPEKVIGWTTKNLRNIEKALREKGFEVGRNTIGNILKETGYGLRQNQKVLQSGEPHVDRNARFEYINKKCGEFIHEGRPVISVDTRKKEPIGNFKNTGVEYHQTKTPDRVMDHDFSIKELGKVTPYGIHDINRNEGFVNPGLSHDTAEFAVENILRSGGSNQAASGQTAVAAPSRL
jgi:hypothetical protein